MARAQLKKLWTNFNENFRVYQKWPKLHIIKFSHLSGSPCRNYSSFDNPECPNLKSYWLTLMEISNNLNSVLTGYSLSKIDAEENTISWVGNRMALALLVDVFYHTFNSA